jgi:hypothetical protein
VIATRADSGTRSTSPPSDVPAASKLSNWSKVSLCLLALVALALAVMSFKGMFTAVRHAVQPYFGKDAWMVPVGTDLGIFFFACADVWLEAHRMQLWWVRWFILSLIGLQLGLNIGAAHGDPLGSAAHAVLPVVFVGIIEFWRYLIRKRRNLIHQSDRERIPFARWVADFKGSRDLRGRMVLWDIKQYKVALAMRQQVLRAEAALKEIFGDKWKKKAPQDLVMMLNTSEYLDEACKEIAKKLADKRKRDEADERGSGDAQAQQRPAHPAAANSGPAAENSARPAAGIRKCCRVHALLTGNSKLPEKDPEKRLAIAKVLWAGYMQAHPDPRDPLGAETLTKVLTIGGGPARELRDELNAWWAQSGSQSGSGSGGQSAPGSGPGDEAPVGQAAGAVGAGHPNGSVVTVGGN